MAKVKIQGHASGTGILTVTAPNTSTDRTITLPDSTGTLATTADVPSSITDNGNATAITIDSSENVLVGKTTISGAFNTVGTELRETGLVQSTVDGSKCVDLNRKSSSGDFIGFSLDATAVGSIGVVSTDRMYFSTADGLGLQFDKDNNRIVPCDNAGAYNSNVELGDENLAFTNLFLTGGIQFDSRSSKLYDYEEGTWTPAATLTHNPNSRTVSTTSSSGYYTKIGRFVTVFGNLQYNIAASPSGAFNMGCSGLPFSTSVSVTGGGTARDNQTGSMYILQAFNGTTVGVFRKYNNLSTPDTTNTTLSFSFTYQTI